jgi:hypothetical protein
MTPQLGERLQTVTSIDRCTLYPIPTQRQLFDLKDIRLFLTDLSFLGIGIRRAHSHSDAHISPPALERQGGMREAYAAVANIN